jgi:uncharacterized protein YjbJ (UPF0337 family)
MSFADRARHRAEEMAGAAKERVGQATDNQRMEAEGKAQRTEAHAREAADKAKAAGRNVRETFRG